MMPSSPCPTPALALRARLLLRARLRSLQLSTLQLPRRPSADDLGARRPARISRLLFHPSRPVLAVAERDEVSVWRYGGGAPREAPAEICRFSNLAGGAPGGRICELALLNATEAHAGASAELAASSAPLLLVGSEDGVVRVWRDWCARRSAPAAHAPRHPPPCPPARLRPSSPPAFPHAPPPPQPPLCTLHARRDGVPHAPPRLVTAFAALEELMPVSPVGSAARGMHCVWSQRLGLLLTCSRAAPAPVVHVWDLATERCAQRLQLGLEGADHHVTALCEVGGGLSSAVLAAGASDGSIRLYDTRSGPYSFMAVAAEHRSPIVGLQSHREADGDASPPFSSPHGGALGRCALVSGDLSGELRYWDARAWSSALAADSHRIEMSCLALHARAPVRATRACARARRASAPPRRAALTRALLPMIALPSQPGGAGRGRGLEAAAHQGVRRAGRAHQLDPIPRRVLGDAHRARELPRLPPAPAAHGGRRHRLDRVHLLLRVRARRPRSPPACLHYTSSLVVVVSCFLFHVKTGGVPLGPWRRSRSPRMKAYKPPPRRANMRTEPIHLFASGHMAIDNIRSVYINAAINSEARIMARTPGLERAPQRIDGAAGGVPARFGGTRTPTLARNRPDWWHGGPTLALQGSAAPDGALADYGPQPPKLPPPYRRPDWSGDAGGFGAERTVSIVRPGAFDRRAVASKVNHIEHATRRAPTGAPLGVGSHVPREQGPFEYFPRRPDAAEYANGKRLLAARGVRVDGRLEPPAIDPARLAKRVDLVSGAGAAILGPKPVRLPGPGGVSVAIQAEIPEAVRRRAPVPPAGKITGDRDLRGDSARPPAGAPPGLAGGAVGTADAAPQVARQASSARASVGPALNDTAKMMRSQIHFGDHLGPLGKSVL